MNLRYATTLLFSTSMLLAAGAQAGTPLKAENGVLVNKAGMTLYTFDKDVANSGKSACVDQCAKAWPPAVANNDAAPQDEYSVIMRTDGKQQWAYNGMPLYTFAKDAKPGEKKGDNFKDVWHVINQ